MKKLISIVLLFAMVLGLFAGCGKDKEAASDLKNAAEYLTSMYQTAGKDEAILITADQDVLKAVVVDGVSYAIEWSVEVTEGDADSVKVAESTKENHVKLDIPLHSGSDILFTATATISDAEGNTEAVTFNYKVAGVKLAGEGMTMEELVEAAYALDEDQALEGLAVLTGKVTVINTPYDEGYKNLTCTIVVGDLTDRPIKCYRLKGEGADTLAVGDTITVSGTLKNYGGTIEFDAGCMIDELIKNTEEAPVAPTDPMQIVQDAYALEAGSSLPYNATLTGTITSVDTPYDAGYQNVTVTITVAGCEDMPIKCYRLKGEGADRLAVGDTITVTGVLMNYNGTVEFAQGCTLDAIVTGGEVVAPTDQLAIVDEAYTLAPDAVLPYTATLTGKITSVDTPYDATYQNITVTIVVTGREQKPIKCYRIKGDGVDGLTVGDTITVTGTIKNYGGTVEFDAGSTVTAIVKGTTNIVKPATEVEIVDQAYKLSRDQSLPYVATLTGKVVYVKELYNSQYKNISVVIQVPGRENRPIICYRMKGEGADKLAVKDTITVTGTIKNYNGSIQFDTGCTMSNRISGGGKPDVAETDPMKIVDMAYALEKDQQMAYDVTLTGKVIEFVEIYNEQYKSITVILQVRGRESKPIQLFGLKGDDVAKVAEGDTITVMGRMKNYNGTIEMVNGSLTSRTSGGGTPPVKQTDPAKILAAGAALKDNQELPYTVTLTGKVVSIDEAYNAEYQNVTATISVNGTNATLKLYRLKGDKAKDLAVNDTVTVEGKIKKFYGELELVSCTITAWKDGGNDAPVAQTDYKKIVDEAYALAQGASLAYTATLEGRITELKSPYDAQYKNMTVVIVVTGREDKPIECYRMKGDNIGNHLCVGDTITVEGKIKNYNGTVEFDAGCKMTNRKAGSVTKPTDPKQIVDAAFALGENAVLPYFATLTGTVKSIDEPYTDQYKNVTLTMTVQGTNGAKDIICYRMKGDTAATVAVGNTITVTGAIKRFVRDKDGVHEDKVEFDSGCVLESLQKSSSLYIQTEPVTSQIEESLASVQTRAAETNTAKIMADAFALDKGASLSYEATLTGKITSVKDPYNSSYKNISVIIEVPGYADKPMLCYRIKGEGADKLAVGDTITVTGTIINYNGTVEFGAGSTLDKVISGGGTAAVAPEDPKQIVDEAFALESGKSLPYSAKLTGKVISIDGEYSEQYKNITLTIEVEGTSGKKNMVCYRLKGTGVETLKVGDVIVVEGIIQRYIKLDSETGDVLTDKVEFNGASLIEIVADQGDVTDTKMTVKVVPHDQWEACYVYSWGPDVFGGWPGTELTAGNGYSFELTGAVEGMVISAGNGKPQTTDIKDLVFAAGTSVTVTVGEAGADGKHTYTITMDGNGGIIDDEDDVPTTTNEIIDAAYALEDGEVLDGTYTLTGVIASVDSAYSEQYKNITVTIKVPGSEDKPLKCYRLSGEGAEKLAVGDTITVTGSLTNYKGSIQFAQGCTLDKVISGGNTAPVAPEDPKQIVDEAYALPGGATLPYTATLTGKVTEIQEAYDATYKNVTVKIVIEGRESKPIVCYRMSGTGADAVKVGDTITVTGTLKNYVKTSDSGETTYTIEFTPCTLTAIGGSDEGDNNQGGNNQGGNNQGGNNQSGNNSGNNQSGNNSGSNSGDKTPSTGDYSLAGVIIVMVMASATALVLTRKKFCI